MSEDKPKPKLVVKVQATDKEGKPVAGSIKLNK